MSEKQFITLHEMTIASGIMTPNMTKMLCPRTENPLRKINPAILSTIIPLKMAPAMRSGLGVLLATSREKLESVY